MNTLAGRRSRAVKVAACTVTAASAIGLQSEAAYADDDSSEQVPSASKPDDGMPTDARERSKWAAERASHAFDTIGQARVEQLQQAELPLTSERVDVGLLRYGDDGTSSHATAVIERLVNDGIRLTFTLESRPSADDVTFNVSLNEGIVPQIIDSGQVVFWHDEQVAGVISAPWALDADGAPVRTWFEIDGDQLVQRLELNGETQYPVVADPTYWSVEAPVSVTGTARQYVYGNVVPDKAFIDRHGYVPEWGQHQGVTRVVDRGGECSWAPDTLLFYDFQIPCEMHDYCWDLIRAGYGGTVSKDSCDSEFYFAMDQHCNWRSNWQSQCRSYRTTFYQTVRQFSP